MPINTSRKGKTHERKVAKIFDAIPGARARRVIMSGAAGTGRDGLSGDVRVDIVGVDLIVECKKRKGAAGFAQLERWKGAADVLVLERDNGPSQLFIDLKLFAQLIEAAIAHGAANGPQA